MTNRRIIVEAAFGFGPFDTVGPGDWVPLVRPDGTTRAKEAAWSIGRDDELDPHPPGTATVVLWNRDRELDPDNPTSTWAGELLPLVPVRIRSEDIDTLVVTDEFYGCVDSGWEQVLAPKGTGDCRIELVDLLGVIGGYRLPGVFEHAVMSLDPYGYWPLTGGGPSHQDLGTGRNDATEIENPGVGAVFPGLGPAVEFDGQAQRIDISRGRLDIDNFHCTVVATFVTRVPAEPFSEHPIYLALDGGGVLARNLLHLYVHTDGRCRWGYVLDGAGWGYESPGRVDDGRPHIAIGQSNGGSGSGSGFGLAVDTATLSTSVQLPFGQGGNGVAIGGTPGGARHFDDNYFPGAIGHVAIYDAVLTEADRQSLVDATTALAGARSDEQISWALDRLGVPAGLRNLDEGSVLMGPADTGGRDALEWIRDVVATEQGELYIDHRDGGRVRFRQRYARHLDAGSTTSQATFSDDPTAAGTVRYPAEGLEVAGNGRVGIINQVTVSWVGGEITRQHAASIAAYGPRSRQINTVATTAPQAESAAEWLISRYRSPRSRVRGVTASRRTTSSRDDQVHALEIGDRVTFRVRPLHTGTATEVDLWVDGIDNQVRGVEWVTSFRFAPCDTFVPWIWGTSEWDVDNLWG